MVPATLQGVSNPRLLAELDGHLIRAFHGRERSCMKLDPDARARLATRNQRQSRTRGPVTVNPDESRGGPISPAPQLGKRRPFARSCGRRNPHWWNLLAYNFSANLEFLQQAATPAIAAIEPKETGGESGEARYHWLFGLNIEFFVQD